MGTARAWAPLFTAALLGLSGAASADVPDPVTGVSRAFTFTALAGPAVLAPVGASGWRPRPALGLALGTRFGNGLSVALRYDNLALRPYGGDGTPWQLVTMEARYTFLLRTPSPYAEGALGASLVSSDVPLGPGDGPLEVDLGVGAGVGLTIQLSELFALDLGLRAYAAPAVGTWLRALVLQVGLELDVTR